MRAFRITALGALGPLLGGCFAYVPTDLDAVRVDDDVRTRVSASQARELDPILLQDARVLEGRVIEIAGDLLIEIPVVSDLRGARVQTLHQRVRLPREEILDVELRSLDRMRTGLLLGGGLAVVLGLTIRELTKESGGDPSAPGPDPTETRIPLVRIPFELRR